MLSGIFLRNFADVVPETMLSFKVSVRISELRGSIDSEKCDFPRFYIEYKDSKAPRNRVKIMNKREEGEVDGKTDACMGFCRCARK